MIKAQEKKGLVFILGISSDIGWALARLYLQAGHKVVGTYRSRHFPASVPADPRLVLLACDVGDPQSIARCIAQYRRKVARPWDVFISAVGSMEPIGGFFKADLDAWEGAVRVNTLAQLRFLHGIYPFRRKKPGAHVAFFAGAGTNNAAANYSAYCASKIFLIKMCELLDDENKDLNVFIVGPGWVRTKIHEQTLKCPKTAPQNYKRTRQFMASGDAGTPYADIFACINWCVAQGRTVCGGRNFSVVHDAWRASGKELARALRADTNKFKLRRYKNT